ncbi:hypothetical protein CGZ93_03080 [Enemella dayhoffiae]|uniref:ATP-grasp domain-containing protein n=2 Tax=Enemella dayhoffiae TaxID=2016507 RepID=A0A255HAI6_9ACTN|nr:hypothetical protein CGZ93_03080 [Enemella dayhoffiae]
MHGYPCFNSVAELPGPVDVAVIALPAGWVAAAIAECGGAGIPVAVVYASGFGEVGAAGAQLERELAEAARAAGVRLVGPNCNGVIVACKRMPLTFMSGVDDPDLELRDHGAAFVTQSGAMGAFVLQQAQAAGFGLGTFVSTGNETDTGTPELIELLLDQPGTEVVLSYLEGIEDPPALAAAFDEASRREVPVVVMKVGRSAAGAAAAASHTGALAGADEVVDGFLSQHRAIRAHDLDELLDLGRIFCFAPALRGRRLSVVTLSGGAGVLVTDAAEEHGLRVPGWSADWRERMAAVLPSFASTGNPIDVTGALLGDTTLLARSLDVAISHPDTDAVLVVLGNMQTEEDEACAMIADAARRTDKPVVTVWVGGTGRVPGILAEAGLPAFTEPVRAVRAIAALAEWHRLPALPGARRTPADAPGAAPVQLDEVAAKQLLADAGIPTARERAVHTVDEAITAAEELGFPVVVKFLSAEVGHKSELGLVRVGLPDAAAVREAAGQVLDRAPSDVADRRLLVQEMVLSDTELILGMKRDPVFGPVVLLGIGGVLTEVTADAQVRVPPLSEADAHSMMDSLALSALLDGPQGRTPVDRAALAQVLRRFADLAAGTDLAALEVNPLLVRADGSVVAVDALAVIREAG